MITPHEYKKSQHSLKVINKKEREQEKTFEREALTISNKYYKLERRLSDKKCKELRNLRKETAKFEEETEKLKEPHNNNDKQFKRIIDFMGVKKSKKDIDLNIEVYNWDYPRDDRGEVIQNKNGNYPEKEKIYEKPLAVLKNNEFCKIAVYIYENDKPKNRFTLCLIGRSIFHHRKKILNFGSSWSSGMNENGHFKKVLRELPDRKDLIKCFRKNKEEIANYKSDEFEEVIKEYKEVIEKTNCNKWEIAYLEDRKDYYENDYSHGTETKEYFEVIQGLLKITKGKKKEGYLKIIKQKIVDNLE